MELKHGDIKCLEAIELWIWRWIERISWTEPVMIEEVLQRVSEKRQLISIITERQAKW